MSLYRSQHKVFVVVRIRVVNSSSHDTPSETRSKRRRVKNIGDRVLVCNLSTLSSHIYGVCSCSIDCVKYAVSLSYNDDA